VTVYKYNPPDQSADTFPEYKNNIDSSIRANASLATNFYPHESSTPAMTVDMEAGRIWDFASGALIEEAARVTSTITAPVTNPRIDRIEVDPATGNYSILTGVESASPIAPAYTAGHYPICQILLAISDTAIYNTQIIDERPLVVAPIPEAPEITHFFSTTKEYTFDSTVFVSLNNVTGVIAEGVLTTVGPTGSGATYIWSALDYIPANAKYVDLFVTWASNGVTGNNINSFCAFHKEGATAYHTRVALYADNNSAGSLPYQSSVNVMVRVPLASLSNIFEVGWFDDPTNTPINNQFTIVSFGV